MVAIASKAVPQKVKALGQSLKVGLAKGFPTTKIHENKNRPSRRKGSLSKRVKLIRDVVRDVSGLAPYEKRVLDIIKTGGGSAEKRTYKFAKLRLGTHTRAIAKREEIKGLYAKMRARS